MVAKRGLLFVFVFLLCVPFAFAQDAFNVTFFVETEGVVASNILVDYKVVSLSENVSFEGVAETDEFGRLFFDLEPSFYDFYFAVSYDSTPGFDYFGKLSSKVSSSSSFSLPLFSVGSAQLVVVDRDELPVGDVLVKVDCQSRRGEVGYFRTDEFGLVELSYLPVGNCVIRATLEDVVVSENIFVEKGSKTRYVLQFSDYSQHRFPLVVVIVVVFLIVLATVLFLFYSRGYGRKSPSRGVGREAGKESYSREDLLDVLGSTEKKVVKFILDEEAVFVDKGGRAKNFYLIQSRIVHGLRMPKTTLSRVLLGLEQKQVVSIISEGKLKKIALNEKFRKK